MSISKTSKLLQYINYRELLCSEHVTFIQTNTLVKHVCIVNAGMRVTILDGRQIVGRYLHCLDFSEDMETMDLLENLSYVHLAGSWLLTDT